MASSSKQDIEQRYASMSINDGEEDGLILGEINEEVQFFHEFDMQRVLDDGPWTFNNQALMVRRLEMGEQLSDIKLNELYIWVQIHELPVGFNSEIVLRSIGNYIGKFLMVDPKNFQSIWRQFVSIKVAINVNKPLKSQMRMKKAGGDWMWVKFKYERLPSFCFYCGIIGHSEKFCESLYDEAGNIGVRNYDASLRAPMRNNIDAGKNQWLRNAGGGKLRPKKMNENVGDDELTRTESVGIMVTRSQNYGIQLVGDNQGNSYDGRAKLSKVQNLKSGKEGENVMTSIGLFIGDPKRRRVYDNKDVGLTEGHSPDDENMVDSEGNIMSNPKNLLEAGAAMQARLGL
ncbi:uncharacterized protein LOC141691963 [Apium graveolens]|uniref:uncharacterized protein LOC141691963 n=1 Tax=Apium graveolens TaxID=4045 RepID=UPI003D7AA57E